MKRWENTGKKQNREGFTLVELIVVLLVLSIVAAISVPALLGFIDEGQVRECTANREALAENIAAERMAYEVRGDDAEAPETFDIQTYIDHSSLKCPTDGHYTYEEVTAEDGTGTSYIIKCDKHGDTELPSAGGTGLNFNITDNSLAEEPHEAPTSAPTLSPEKTPEPIPTTTPEPTPTPGTEEGPTETPLPEETPTPTPLPTVTPGPIETPTPEPEETPTPEPTETPTPEPTASPTPSPEKPDMPVNEHWDLDEETFAVGSWYAFCQELKLWGDSYTAGDGNWDGHQRVFYTEEDEKRNYYIFIGNNGGTGETVSGDITGEESPEEYNEKYPGYIQQIDPNVLSSEEAQARWPDGETIPPGVVVCRDGGYYVSCGANAALENIGTDGANWFLLEDAYVPWTVIKVGDITYPATEENALKQLEPEKKKWFEPGNLYTAESGKLYVCGRPAVSCGGGEPVPETMLEEHFLKVDPDACRDYEEIADREENAPTGEVVKYEGRYYIQLQNSPYSALESGGGNGWIPLR